MQNFKCQQTGNCCRVEGVVVANQSELVQMADFLDIDLATFLMRFTVVRNGYRVLADKRFRPDCFLNESAGCSIYPVRPKACKTYPHWNTIWESRDSFFKELLVCKGLKKAYGDVKKNDPLFNI